MYTTQGVVKSLSPVEKVGQKQYSKRTLLLSTQDKYTPVLSFDVFGKKVDEIPSLKSGDNIEVSFSIRCNENNGRFYTSLNVDSISVKGGSVHSGGNDTKPFVEVEESDVPF